MADPFPDVLDMRQVAKKLGKSHSWLKDYLRRHPCGTMIGAKRVFPPGDFAILLNSFPKDEPKCPSRSTRRTIGRSIGGSAAASEVSAFNDLLARLSAPKR